MTVPRGRTFWAIAATVVVVLAGVVVLPTRTWIAQTGDIAAAEAELAELTDANEALAAKIELLGDPDTIEQQARELYGYVYPRQETYTVPPGDAPTIDLPDVWPFGQLEDPLQRSARRLAAPDGPAGS